MFDLQFFQGKTILITGGSGYIAYSLCSLLGETDCFVRILSRHPEKFRQAGGKASYSLIRDDISDPDVWKDCLQGVDIIFHLASQTSVYVANEDPLKDLEFNFMPMVRILETCRKENLHPIIIMAGTATEMGLVDRIPVGDDVPAKPVTAYCLHKLCAGEYLLHYTRLGYVKGCVLRLANVYGPGPKSGSADRGILNLMVKRALEGKELNIYGSGLYLRDYIHVTDVAKAFLIAAKRIERTNGGRYLIGTGIGHTLVDAVEKVVKWTHEKTGETINMRHVSPPEGLSPIESRNFIADCHGFVQASGWAAKIDLDTGIKSLINYYDSENNQL